MVPLAPRRYLGLLELGPLISELSHMTKLDTDHSRTIESEKNRDGEQKRRRDENTDTEWKLQRTQTSPSPPTPKPRCPQQQDNMGTALRVLLAHRCINLTFHPHETSIDLEVLQQAICHSSFCKHTEHPPPASTFTRLVRPNSIKQRWLTHLRNRVPSGRPMH